jgi:protein subunit release factor B
MHYTKMMFQYLNNYDYRLGTLSWISIRGISSGSRISEPTKISINDIRMDCLEFKFSRSSGPGGQNVNKVNTKVELRMDLKNNRTISWLSEDVLKALKKICPNRINRDHELILTCDTHRSQKRNREECIEKLRILVLDANNIAKGPEGPSIETQQKIEQL